MSEKNSSDKYIILGCGLAGLSLGYFFDRDKSRDFLVLEKEPVPGGLCRTEKEGRFLFDYTGHLLHFKDKKNFDFVSGLIPLKKNFRRAYIRSNDVFTNYPFQENTYGLPDKVRYECLRGFIEALLSKRRIRSFADWILSSFGSGIARHFMFPYNEKLFRHPLDKITTDWFSRFIPRPFLSDVLTGSFFDKTSGAGYNSVFFYPEKSGIQALTDKLYEKIKSRVSLGAQIAGIDLRRKKIRLASGEQIGYKKLFSTIPLADLALLSGEPELGREALKLKFTSVLNINLGFNRVIDTGKHWIYFPEKKYNFYRVGFHSEFNNRLAPRGASSVYIEISRTCGEKMDVEKEYRDALSGFKEIYGIKEENIIARKDLHISPAYVIYDKERKPAIDRLTEIFSKHDVTLLGRFGRWEYSTMEDAISQAREISEKVESRV